MLCLLLDKYSRPVHSLILKVVRNREDAEELAQDVFMKVFKHLSSFKGECSFSTWIYRIAYNTAISETRKKRHEFLAIEESVINKCIGTRSSRSTRQDRQLRPDTDARCRPRPIATR